MTIRDVIESSKSIGASERELAILARERRSFPKRQDCIKRLLALVPEADRERAFAMILSLLPVPALLDEPGDELVRAQCQRCHYVFVVAEIAACPICGERNVRPA